MGIAKLNDLDCGRPACRRLLKTFIKPESKYINFDARSEKWDSAIIDLRDLTFEDYEAKQRKRYKGNIFRQARKAAGNGFKFCAANAENHIPDIVDINHSMPIRQRGPMKGHYNQSIEEKGGAPKKFKTPVLFPKCPLHWTKFYGVFENIPGYKQGGITTNQRLVGYISLNRFGNLILYSMILGHGDFLKYGIMYFLHLSLLRHILDRDIDFKIGIDFLMYAGYNSGTEGLRQWKRVCLFEPAQLQYRGNLWKR